MALMLMAFTSPISTAPNVPDGALMDILTAGVPRATFARFYPYFHGHKPIGRICRGLSYESRRCKAGAGSAKSRAAP